LLLGFLVIRERTRDPELAHLYRNALFASFVALAVFGLVHAATTNGKLYWVRTTTQPTHPFGPFVNPTNFAGIMELAVPWLAGYALMVARRSGAGVLGLMRTPIFGAGTLLCLAAGLAAASKIAALFLPISLSLLLIVAARSLRVRVAVLGGLAAAWAGAAVLLVNTRLGDRVREFLDLREAGIDRVVAWKASLPMLRDYLVTGSGFGSFRDVFRHYMPRGDVAIWQQAHNDYLEVLLEGGLVAGVLLLWLVALFWLRVLRTPALRSRKGLDLEYVGMLLGLLTLSLHAFIDFNHQIPADALLFVTLAAMTVARAELANAAGRTA
jgi:O-antigen ligase